MRGLSRDERTRELQRGALRHYGRKYAFLILFGPWIVKVLLWVGLLALAYWTWQAVPHVVLGTAALAVATGATLALVWPALAGLNARKQLMRKASGTPAPRVSLGWAYATLLVVGAGMGWLALWSPFA